MQSKYQALLKIQGRYEEAGFIYEKDWATTQRMMLVGLPVSELGVAGLGKLGGMAKGMSGGAGQAEVVITNRTSNTSGAGAGPLIGEGEATAAGLNGASLPTGSKRLQFNQPESPRHQPIRNDSMTIGETDYSGHAIDRMQDRGVMPSVVQNTIDTGVATQSRLGTTVYYDPVNNVSVVTNAQGKVVTVKYGR
jgi:filamentous hemagglutinin